MTWEPRPARSPEELRGTLMVRNSVRGRLLCVRGEVTEKSWSDFEGRRYGFIVGKINCVQRGCILGYSDKGQFFQMTSTFWNKNKSRGNPCPKAGSGKWAPKPRNTGKWAKPKWWGPGRARAGGRGSESADRAAAQTGSSRRVREMWHCHREGASVAGLRWGLRGEV